jgi:hypothetical protein
MSLSAWPSHSITTRSGVPRLAQPPARRLELCRHLLDAIATHQVADRPNCFEPRVKKHRRNHLGWLMKPRAEMKFLMAKGFVKI